MPADADALAELRAALGPAAVLVPGEAAGDLARYTEPARGVGGAAAAVLRPADVDEVRAVVRWARRHRVHLLAQGAASGLVGASTPAPDGPPVVVCSTERLTAGLVVDPVDRTAVVPAGMRLSTLEAALGPHGLTLPIDLGADPTVGGMVATNTGGSRTVRHGDVRRHVLGVEAVIADADASVVSDLSTLRKDNTGIDVSGWFIGSAGSLGIVTRVALDVARRPAAVATALVPLPDDDAALALLTGVESRAGDHLSALEVLSAGAVVAARSVLSGPDPLAGATPPVLALVELSGPPTVHDELLATLAELAVDHPDPAVGSAVVAPPARCWALRHAVSEGLRRAGPVLGLDVSVPRSELPAFLAAARVAVAATDPTARVVDFGHWADGGVHCNATWPPGAAPTSPQRTAVRDAVFALAVERGGSYSAEHGIGPHNADWWRRTTPAPVAALVAALKQACDPDRVLGHPGLPW